MANNEAHTALVRAALEQLAMAGYTAWPNQTGAYKADSGAFIKYGKKGSADILGILPVSVQGRKLGIHCEYEAKTGTGKQSHSQKLHQKYVVERNGGIYILFRAADELIAELRRIKVGFLDRP